MVVVVVDGETPTPTGPYTAGASTPASFSPGSGTLLPSILPAVPNADGGKAEAAGGKTVSTTPGLLLVPPSPPLMAEGAAAGRHDVVAPALPWIREEHGAPVNPMRSPCRVMPAAGSLHMPIPTRRPRHLQRQTAGGTRGATGGGVRSPLRGEAAAPASLPGAAVQGTLQETVISRSGGEYPGRTATRDSGRGGGNNPCFRESLAPG